MAEKVTVSIPHTHGRDGARMRIEDGFATLHEKLGGKVEAEREWLGDVMRFKAGAMGANVNGDLTVSDDHVLVEVELPWMLRGLSGKVQETIRKEGQLLLNKPSRT